VAPHEEQFLCQGNQFDGKGIDVGFFNDNPPAGFEHAEHLARCGGLVNDVVQGVHHNDALEEVVGKGKAFGEGANRLERGARRLSQHAHRNVGDDDFVHILQKRRSNPPRAAADVEQAPVQQALSLLSLS